MCAKTKVELGSNVNLKTEEITTMADVLFEARHGVGEDADPTMAEKPEPRISAQIGRI